MDGPGFERFLARLVEGLSVDPEVLGLVGLGSTARRGRLPDEFSDHDVWVVVEPGRAGRYRSDPGWLPDADRVVLFFPETEHGVKAVYDDGHLVEAAIFEPAELALTRTNDDYAVLFDRDDLTTRLAAIREETRRVVAAGARDTDWPTGQFLTGLLVGVQRHARGERISGHEFVKQYSLAHLLRLLAGHVEAADPDALDELNPYRRVEWAHPEAAARLDALLLLPVPRAALEMLDLLEESVVPTLPTYPGSAAAVVRARIEEVLASQGAGDAR